MRGYVCALAVINAVPAFFAVTRPFSSTTATFSLSDVYFTTLSVSALSCMIFFPFVYNVTDVLFNVNARGSLVGGNGVTVGGVGSITGVASGVELGTSVAAGVGTVGVGTCVGVVVGATDGVGVGVLVGVGEGVGVAVGEARGEGGEGRRR